MVNHDKQPNERIEMHKELSIMRFSITKKIILPFSLLLLLVAALGGFFIFGYLSIHESIEKLERDLQKQSVAQDLSASLSDMLMSVNDYMITGNETYTTNYRREKSEFILRMDKLKSLLPVDAREDAFRTIAEDFRAIDVIAEKIFTRTFARRDDAASQLMEEMDYTHGENLRKELDVFLERMKSQVGATHAEIESKKENAIWIGAAAFLGTLGLGILIVFLTIRKISQPLLNLVKAAQRITVKDFSVQLKVESEDEVGMLTIAFDVMVKEIKRRYDELETFAYVAAHDLKSPLMGIRGFSEILLSEYDSILDAEGKESLGHIIASSDRMAALVNDLLLYAKSGQVGISETPLSIQTMLDEIQLDLSFYLQERNARILIVSDMPSLRCDPIRFSQVWKNLITNAVKYNESPVPMVEIRATEDPEEDCYRFIVRDNGIGIDADKLDEIFLPFKRVARNNKYEGTGIGLPIVKRVIENHGGRITVESTLGVGSTFFITIPKHEIH